MGGFSFLMHFKVILYLIGATHKAILASFTPWFLNNETYTIVQKYFDDTDTNILRVCLCIAYCVSELETAFRVIIFGYFCLYHQ